METLNKIPLNPQKIRLINFKFGDYISQGIDLYKNNFGKLFLAFIYVIILNCIPFCGLMAIGNYYKFCRKLHKGQYADASEIFNFDDFLPYLKFQLVAIAAVIVMCLPMVISIPFWGLGGQNDEGITTASILFLTLYMLAVVGAVFYFSVRFFYYPMLISIAKITDFKTIWRLSSAMTKGNFWIILAFIFVLSILSQIGSLALYIGIIITMPMLYICQFFAFEDALEQVSYDEIEEIGISQND